MDLAKDVLGIVVDENSYQCFPYIDNYGAAVEWQPVILTLPFPESLINSYVLAKVKCAGAKNRQLIFEVLSLRKFKL
jgi:hypothetical protein